MDITELLYGDHIINYVTGLISPRQLGFHLLNVSYALPKEPETQELQLTEAVSQYLDVSEAVNIMLRDPFELKDLESKYGKENLPFVKSRAEDYLEGAIHLLQTMKDLTSSDHKSRPWILRIYGELKAFRDHAQTRTDGRASHLSLVVVDGERVDNTTHH
jgi:hypothetical protein